MCLCVCESVRSLSSELPRDSGCLSFPLDALKFPTQEDGVLDFKDRKFGKHPLDLAKPDSKASN